MRQYYRNSLFLTAILFTFASVHSSVAQTAVSLFWKKDGVQVEEIVSAEASQYNAVGHHGPAVENSHMALRIYFNDSGAIDVYSKTGRGMELEKYLWYPTREDQQNNGAGCDEYMVGKTVGLGGIALWDGKKTVRLAATSGRTARVGKTKKGAYAEMTAYGVAYGQDTVDIRIRIDVFDKSRLATVSAEELSGRKVMFVTGVNYHEGASMKYGDGVISVWGVHPADVSETPVAVGAGMFYSPKAFGDVQKTDDMLMIISRPTSVIRTKVIAASTKEAELNSARRFEAYMLK